jgi:hypothetical protein
VLILFQIGENWNFFGNMPFLLHILVQSDGHMLYTKNTTVERSEEENWQPHYAIVCYLSIIAGI